MRIQSSSRKGKRLVAIFKDGSKVHFGQAGGYTYLDGASEKIRSAYIARHSKNKENWNDSKSAGALSRFILWEKRNLDDAIEAYKSKFGL
jgi:hypothetical protein